MMLEHEFEILIVEKITKFNEDVAELVIDMENLKLEHFPESKTSIYIEKLNEIMKRRDEILVMIEKADKSNYIDPQTKLQFMKLKFGK